MGLINSEIEILLHSKNIKYYESIGYKLPKEKDINNKLVVKKGTKIKVKANDLIPYSYTIIQVKCDYCGQILNLKKAVYSKYVKENGEYYCSKCAYKLYGKTNAKRARLLNSISFGQWGIDNICVDFLEKYWDYTNNIISPLEINYQSHERIWIRCQEKDYHNSYELTCDSFVRGSRCPYCCNHHGNVHPFDSLGKLLNDNNLLNLWSDKNKKSPYEYAPMSRQKVWWKCPENKHKDYQRNIDTSNNMCSFRCPECNYSKGEKKIEEFFNSKKIYYIPQKPFEGLVGLGNGLLLYDFYLPYHNSLIEFNGIQHCEPIDFLGKGKKHAEEQFKKQQEHDKRKREYANKNNINLLEIWYWDFDNIEEILNTYLQQLK